MNIFIDSLTSETKRAFDTGLIDGITTNPLLLLDQAGTLMTSTKNSWIMVYLTSQWKLMRVWPVKWRRRYATVHAL